MPKTFWISTGNSRKETSWKNVELSWEEIAERLSTPIVTAETLKEFTKFDKTLQNERKDVGGYVGGTIAGGRRKKDNVTARSLITLETDLAGPDFWDDFQEFFGCAALVHGTRKHLLKEEKTNAIMYRYRLVIPLAREVQPDEYEAVARRVAGILGIDLFDRTTFQADRLMYWPSVSKDQELYWKRQDGAFMDPDKILSSYRDWRDQSQWPYAAGIIAELKKEVKKKDDPLEKRGVVGAFCRTYNIVEAIEEFLPGVYGETEDPNRFTFLAGSTFGGLVIYEDKFAFSHHGTDPISGQLVNAFDLIRLHKYGDLDKDVKEKTNITKYPSYIAMCAFAMKIGPVREDSIRQNINKVKEMFGDEVEIIDPAADEWIRGLEGDKNGKLLNTINNVLLILRNDRKFKGAICWDELAQRPLLRRNLPWRKIKDKPEFGEDDDANLRLYLEAQYQLTNISKINDAVTIVSRENGFHPVKDYLRGLGEWDKTERLERLLVDYLGAEDNVYTREVTRKNFCGCSGQDL